MTPPETMFGTIVDNDRLTFVRNLSAPVSRVWAYLTVSDHLFEWLSSGVIGHFVGAEVRLDVGVTGEITVFEPQHLLEYTWKQTGLLGTLGNRSLVRWELERIRADARLTFRHSGLQKHEMHPYAAGWHVLFDCLAAILERRATPPLLERYSRLKEQYVRRLLLAGLPLANSSLNSPTIVTPDVPIAAVRASR